MFANINLTKAPIILCIFSLLTSQALAAPGDITDSDKIGDLIAKFERSMADLLRLAGSESRVTLMVGYQQTDALIQSVKLNYKDALQETVRTLDQEQRKVFESINHSIGNLETLTKGPIANAMGQINSIKLGLGKFALKTPLVDGYGPANIAPASQGDEIKISVTGYNLCLGDVRYVPKLRIGGNEFRADARGECTDGRLNFVVPRTLFAREESKVSLASTELELYYDPSSWFNTKPIAPVKFSLIFNVLPLQLGTIEYKSTFRTKKYVAPVLFQSPEYSVSSHAGHNGDETRCYPLDVNGGWKYDFEHIEFVKTLSGNENKGDFVIADHVQGPYNICVRLMAAITDEHNWAHSTGYIKVNKVLDGNARGSDEYEEREQSRLVTLTWSDKHLSIYANAFRQIIKITLFGDRDASHEASALEQTILPYLRIEPDTRNSVVFFRPQRDW